MGRLENKVALVSGAASGIGRATALRLSDEGAKIVIVDLNKQGAEAVAEEIEDRGGTAVGWRTDVSSEEGVLTLFEDVRERFGGVDILHNNAGATGQNGAGGDGGLLEMSLERWELSIAVNLRGPMLMSRSAVPQMQERGGGSIINTMSTAALAGGLRLTAYAASKAGIIGLTQHVATQFGKDHIRCNAIAPGLVLTAPMMRTYTEEAIAALTRENLVPFIGTPENIASVVAFLASDDAAYVTGQVITVDGGSLTHKPGYNSELEYETIANMSTS